MNREESRQPVQKSAQKRLHCMYRAATSFFPFFYPSMLDSCRAPNWIDGRVWWMRWTCQMSRVLRADDSRNFEIWFGLDEKGLISRSLLSSFRERYRIRLIVGYGFRESHQLRKDQYHLSTIGTKLGQYLTLIPYRVDNKKRYLRRCSPAIWSIILFLLCLTLGKRTNQRPNEQIN